MAHGKILGHVETPTFLHARSHCLKASTLGCYLYFNPRMYIIAWNFWGSMQMAHGKIDRAHVQTPTFSHARLHYLKARMLCCLHL